MGEDSQQQILMKIFLVGSGNVASCIAGALQAAGHEIAGVYSRTEANARTLAGSLGCGYVCDVSSIPPADVYLVMLRDDALLSLAAQIVAANPDGLFLHTSGSVPMSVWSEAGARHYGVFYPMQTFSKGKQVEWRSVPLFLEAASADDMIQLRGMASSISDNVSELDSEKRAEMHLAAVFVSNFSNRMYAIAESLLAECGIPFSVMYPLIEETASKATEISPHDAQTGPAIRGDERVTDMHSALLASHPEWRELYEKISEDIRSSYSR